MAFFKGSWIGAGATRTVSVGTGTETLAGIFVLREGVPPLGGGNIVSGLLWYTDPTLVGGGTDNKPVSGSAPPGTITVNAAGSFTVDSNLDLLGVAYNYLGWTLDANTLTSFYDGDGTASKVIATGLGATPLLIFIVPTTFPVSGYRFSQSGYKVPVLHSGGRYIDINSLGTQAGLIYAGGTVTASAAFNDSGRRYYYLIILPAADVSLVQYLGNATIRNITGAGFAPNMTIAINRSFIPDAEPFFPGLEQQRSNQMRWNTSVLANQSRWPDGTQENFAAAFITAFLADGVTIGAGATTGAVHGLNINEHGVYSGGGPDLQMPCAMLFVNGRLRGSTTTVVTSGTPAQVGTPVTFTATVTRQAGLGTPTGSVTFLQGLTVLGSALLNGLGVATLTTSTLPVGTEDITALYEGDDDWDESLALVSQTISAESVATPGIVAFGSGLGPRSGAGTPGPARRVVDRFRYTISPLGADAAQTPTYSPAREVTGSAPQGKRRASQSESAKNARRGD